MNKWDVRVSYYNPNILSSREQIKRMLMCALETLKSLFALKSKN